MKISLYHHRARKAFEKWFLNRDIQFIFDGYECGYYDPVYILDADPFDWSKCPVSVWDENGCQLCEK